MGVSLGLSHGAVKMTMAMQASSALHLCGTAHSQSEAMCNILELNSPNQNTYNIRVETVGHQFVGQQPQLPDHQP
jgi:hypothetical protein